MTKLKTITTILFATLTATGIRSGVSASLPANADAVNTALAKSTEMLPDG